jgi:serine/threonine-protein kinase
VAHEGPDGVVHRDLKLENFMLTKDRAGQEIVKVLDFGIAKLAEKEADSRLTTVGTLGTPGYAAPEQLRAEQVDARTDLFAFGVVLYGLLTGKDPWLGNRAGESTTEIYQLMVATDRCEVIPMSETEVSVPPAMESIVMKLLRREADSATSRPRISRMRSSASRPEASTPKSGRSGCSRSPRGSGWRSATVAGP